LVVCLGPSSFGHAVISRLDGMTAKVRVRRIKSDSDFQGWYGLESCRLHPRAVAVVRVADFIVFGLR
jgi:hypothetical protein